MLLRSVKSLRLKLLALLLVLSLIATAAATWQVLATTSRSMRRAALDRAQDLATMVRASLLAIQEDRSVQDHVAALVRERTVLLAVVAGGNPPRVLACSHPHWVGLPVDALPAGAVRDELYDAFASRSGQSHLDDVTDAATFTDYFEVRDSEGRASPIALIVELDATRMRQAVAEARVTGLIWGLVAVAAVTVAAAYIIHRTVLRPVARIHHAVSLRRKGETVARAPVLADHELGALAMALNASFDAVDGQSARLQSILDTAAESIIVFDERGVIETANRAAEATFGNAPDGLVGRNVSTFVPALANASEGTGALCAKCIQPKRLANGSIEADARRADGKVFPVEASISETPGGGRRLFTVFLRDVTERRQMLAELQQRTSMVKMEAEISARLVRGGEPRTLLQECAQSIVNHTRAAFARIWTLNEAGDTLELQASAGLYTHIDGGHARVPVGQLKIGWIAANRKPHLTNSVVGDPLVGDQEWAKREGMVSFAGYPLIIADRVAGVVAMFARHALPADMLTTLAIVANTLAVGIDRQRSVARLKQYTTELETANAEMRTAREEAEAGNRAKSDFLANMSHEIRTPMTAILGFADVLMEAGNIAEAPAIRVQAVEAIGRNASHLLAVINNILDISKIESGKMTLESVEIPLADLLSDIADVARCRADAKALTFEMASESAIPRTIRSDGTRIRQVLLNLVGNAAKFTSEGRIALRVRLDQTVRPHMLEFDVEDTGIGMSESQAALVFVPFSQADASMTRRFGGTGLGLVISRRLARLLGGDVVLVRSQEGRGSLFRFSLPVAPEAMGTLVDQFDCARRMAKAPAKSQEPELAGMRLLIAEDSADNRRLIEFMLNRAGAQFVFVESGDAAVAAVQGAEYEGPPFDLVIMDMQMPVMDGYTATRILREGGYARPIIALTAHAMSSDRQKCLDAGCSDYLTKPFNQAKLVTAIKHALEPAAARA